MAVSAVLTRDLRLLISFAALRNVADLFFGTFFISYIMHLAANEIVAVSMYKLFEFAATMAGYILFANWCKRHSKVAVFGLNLIPKAALLIAIIALGDAVVDYIIPLGLLYGVGAAMYHLPMHTMVGEKVGAPAMTKFIGIKSAVIYAVKIAAPVILGLFISIGSYTEMACALLVLTGIEALLVFTLSPSRHRSRRPIDFLGFAKCMFRFPIIRKLMLIEILRGISTSGALGTVITMYTVYMFHTDLNLGIFTTIFSVCSIVSSYLFGRFARRRNFPHILMWCMLVSMGAIAWFLTDTTPMTFLVYNFIYATAMALMIQICDINVYNLSQSKCVSVNHKVEYFVFRDGALFVGRWIAFVALMYVGVFGDESWLRYYLLGLTAAVMAVGMISVRLSARIRAR